MPDLREQYVTEHDLKEEVICGFTVSGEMKRVWAAEQKVLTEVIRICEKYNIMYYADYGTLLGAVRHKGFVPWDDDIDICLKRSDYMRLLEVLPKELPSNYFISSCYNNINHNQPWSTVSDYYTLPIPLSIQKQFFNCPYVVGLDIYMIDYVPRDKEMAELMISMYNVLYDFTQRFEELKENNEVDKYVDIVEELCNVKLVRDNTLRNQLYKLQDNIASMFTEEESDTLTLLPRVILGDTDFRYDKHWFDDVIKMDFNGMKINVPIGYDEILKLYYGDYMEYTMGQSAHGYPVYAEQKEYLQSINMLL